MDVQKLNFYKRLKLVSLAALRLTIQTSEHQQISEEEGVLLSEMRPIRQLIITKKSSKNSMKKPR